MSDTTTTVAAETQSTEVKQPSTMGKVERFGMDTFQEKAGIEQSVETKVEEKVNPDAGGADTKKPDEIKNDAPALTEHQLKAFFEKQGINYEGLDKLKEKINYTPAKEQTPEEKIAQENAQEKRRLDLFISGGGTAEQYVAFKKLAETDPKELSVDITKHELLEAGFTEAEVTEIMRERYYQIDDEDLEKFDNETDKEFAKRKKEYGTKKLEGRSLHIKEKALSTLQQLNDVLASQDSQVQNENKLLSNIDEHFKTVQRTNTFDMGQENGVAIPPVKYDVPETALSEIQTTWKDAEKRKQFLYNQDGSLNHTKIIDLQIENAALKSAAKAIFHEGGSRQVAEFQKVFPNSAHELGVGGNGKKPTGETGQIASAGKPIRAKGHPLNN